MATSPINIVGFEPLQPQGELVQLPVRHRREAPAELAHPREIIRWALESFDRDRLAVVTGLQADGMAVVDMALRIDPKVRIATIDTGRLPSETLAYIDTVRAHYGRDIEIIRPQTWDVVDLVARNGADGFYVSPERRLECCDVRKVQPLTQLLDGLDCWLTGLRRSQSQTRSTTSAVEHDVAHGGVTKVNPVAWWSEGQVLEYNAEHGVPRHPLTDQGFRSIGCAPCTRAVRPGEDERAGRWWWEQGIDTECGIHNRPAIAVAAQSS